MNIVIRTCDDWVAVYKDGQLVWQNHSCSLSDGLTVLRIPFQHEDFDDRMDHDLGALKDGTDPFPEVLT